MATSLLTSGPVFHPSLAHLDQILKRLDPPASWSLISEPQKSQENSRLAEAEISQPCCTAVQISVVDVLRCWGVKAHAVVGRSSGEIAAAYASGALTASEAIMIAYYRGLAAEDVVKAACAEGGMAAVGLGHDDSSSLIKPRVTIACENSPSLVTLSGDVSVLLEVMDEIKREKPDVLVRRLRVNRAYHSRHMRPVATSYASQPQDIIVKRREVQFYSSVTGGLFGDDIKLDEEYWVQSLTSLVLFSQAMISIMKKSEETEAKTLSVEIGPHSALQGPIDQICRARGTFSSAAVYLSSLTRTQDSEESLLSLAGSLYQDTAFSTTAGLLNLKEVVTPGQVLVDLPTYPWHRPGPYWSEGRLSRASLFQRFKHHELLGSRVVDSGDAEPAWRCLLTLDDVPWLRGQRIIKDIGFPGTGYITMAGEAAQQLGRAYYGYTCRYVTIGNAMMFREGRKAEVVPTLKPARMTESLDSVWYDFCVSSHRNNSTSAGPESWVKQAFGYVRPGIAFDEEELGLRRQPTDKEPSMETSLALMRLIIKLFSS